MSCSHRTRKQWSAQPSAVATEEEGATVGRCCDLGVAAMAMAMAMATATANGMGRRFVGAATAKVVCLGCAAKESSSRLAPRRQTVWGFAAGRGLAGSVWVFILGQGSPRQPMACRRTTAWLAPSGSVALRTTSPASPRSHGPYFTMPSQLLSPGRRPWCLP